MQILTAWGRPPTQLAFSPDGRYLAATLEIARFSSMFGLWDLPAGPAPLWSLPSGLVSAFAFSPDGKWVVGSGPLESARYDVHTGEKADDPFLNAFNPHQFSPDGRFAFNWTTDRATGILRLRCARVVSGSWADVWQKEIVFDPADISGDYRALRLSADGNRLLRVWMYGSGTPRTGIELFDSDTGKREAEWVGELRESARGGEVGPAGTVVMWSGRALFVIDPTDPLSKPRKLLNGSPKHFTSAAFSRDGRWLVTTSNDSAATIWDATTREVHRRCEWQIGRLRTVCFAPNGLKCAAGSDSGQIVVWDLDG